MKEKNTAIALEKILECSPDVICLLDREGKIIEVGEAAKQLLGYEKNELRGKAFTDFIHPEDEQTTLQEIRILVNGRDSSLFRSRLVCKTGEAVFLSWSATKFEEEGTFFFVGRPVGEIQPAREKLQRSEELHRILVEQSFDMVGLLDEAGNYLYVGGTVTKLLGYKPEQLVGRNVFCFIHPDDLEKVKKARRLLDTTASLPLSDFRFRTAGGEWRWMESQLSNQFANPQIKAIVVSSRDISERKSKQEKMEESEQRFRSLFDNYPEMIILENKEGICLDINRAVETAASVPGEKLINQPVASFLPANILPVYESAYSELLKGRSVRFEVEVEFSTIGKRMLDVSKVPVMVKGELSGVFTIANDITALARSNQLVREQKGRLNTIFESITDAFFTLDKKWHITYANSEFDRLLGTKKEELTGKNFWDVFPEEKGGIFYNEYRKVLETEVAAHFEVYLTRQSVWLEVKVFPLKDGLAVYFSDISRRVEVQEELKKLSVVAEKSHNGIIIADKTGRIEWVNKSFAQISGFAPEQVIGKKAVRLLKMATFLNSDTKKAIRKIADRESFEGEISFISKDRKKIWLKVGAIPLLDAEKKSFRYIIMLTDISLQKQVIQERNRFIEELQSRNRSLRQFSHVVSHQLRSPVANILGLTSLFELPNIDNETKEQVVGKIGQAAGTLDAIIRDLNRVLSLQEPLGLKGESVLLEEIFAEVVEGMEEQVKEKEVEIHSNFHAAPFVYAVRTYLYDILANLLRNAIIFRAKGRKAVIEVTSKDEEGCIVLLVKDNGIGFNLEGYKKDVFGLYKRFHEHVGGRGLGLYLVKTQVETLGGKVEVQSKVGEGSTFKVFLKKVNAVK